jgi:hypothetical protein
MERTHDPLPDFAAPPPAAGAELIVQNGRLSGSRLPVSGPLTLIGEAAGCDIRLNVEGVAPLQCALAWGPDGLLLRDLAGPGTLVNGRPVATGPLHDGDTITFGPFRFRLSLPAAYSPERAAQEREREALRVQAAAVVAQQAALAEEEERLEQRRAALQRQEEQLAGHLEERRGRLLELQKRVREEREALRKERAASEERLAKDLRDLEALREEAVGAQEQVRKERRRLTGFRQRLQGHYRRQLHAERLAIRRREEEVARQQRQIEQDADGLAREKAELVQARLRLNGEVELARRQVQCERDELGRQQRLWQEEEGRARADLRERQRQLDGREAVVARAEQELADQWQQWEQTRHDLEKEVEGLQARVRNYRRKLAEHAGDVPCAGPAAPAAPAAEPAAGPAPSAPAGGEDPRAADLECLHGELADQRRQLVEECDRLAQAQQHWAQEHQAVVADLEATGERLLEREQAVALREAAVAAGEADMRRRHEEARRERYRAEAWQARLAAREAAWQGDRDRVLAGSQVREEVAQRQWLALVGLRRHWSARRRQELKLLRADHERCQGFRRQYAQLWEECFGRRTELDHRERELAEQALALEQYRQEYLGQAEDAAAAERQLERLRRRWTAVSAAAERGLARDRQELAAEAVRLREEAGLMQARLAEVVRRDGALAEARANWEHEKALAEENAARLRQELQGMQAQRDLFERQMGQVHDELERVAGLLLAGPEPPTLMLAHAA